MKKLLIILVSSLVFSGCTIQQLFIKKPAGLEITTTPQSTVFINGEHEGETPYSNNSIKPGEYTIKLVPQSGDSDLLTWEGKITLSSRATTIISKTLAANETESSGYTLQLKPETNESESYLSVISDPDTSNLTVDGQPHGFTPLTKLKLEPGDHTVEISSPGFKPITIGVNATLGYNLIVNAKLSRELITIKQKEASPSAVLEVDDSTKDATEEISTEESEPNTDTITKPYVIIEETGTGWLRIRSEPNTSTSEELGKADVGERFKYLDSTDNGWHQILFDGVEGWISGKYASIYR